MNIADAEEERPSDEKPTAWQSAPDSPLKRLSFRKLADYWSKIHFNRPILKNEIFQAAKDKAVALADVQEASDIDMIGRSGVRIRENVKRMLRGSTAAEFVRQASQPPQDLDNPDAYEMRRLWQRGGKYREFLVNAIRDALDEKISLREKADNSKLAGGSPDEKVTD